MARASRSNKKQPAFDPSELTDLIHTPAVGRGVGSHLFGASDMATVDAIKMTPVATTDTSTVATQDMTPVGMFPGGRILWITEHGDLVPDGRVKRISVARDVINAAEEAVYETLWTAEPVAGTPRDDRDAWRVVQAGYDYLVKRTRLSKRTIQRIIEKLIDKDFIAIERPADIYLRSSTSYRVFGYQTVLERHQQKGRLHVAKVGPGFAYVRQLPHRIDVDSGGRVPS